MDITFARHNPDLTYGDFIFVTAAKNISQVSSLHQASKQSMHLIFFEGTVQFPRRNCLTQVGGETYHRPRMLYSNVTVNLMS